MTTSRKRTELIREGDYVAEVDVNLIEADGDPWAPYLSVQDAERLDDVRDLLRAGDVQSALRVARIYRLLPVNAA